MPPAPDKRGVDAFVDVVASATFGVEERCDTSDERPDGVNDRRGVAAAAVVLGGGVEFLLAADVLTPLGGGVGPRTEALGVAA